MPLGSAAGGITEGLLGGLRVLQTLEQSRKRESDQRAAGLNLYMRAVETVTKHPEALPHVRAALQPYGMDLDESILGNVEETKKAHSSIGRFLTSGDFESFSDEVQNNPGWGSVIAKSPTLLKLTETAREKADMARAIKSVSQAAREEGVHPGASGWNDFLRKHAFNDPRVAALIKGSSHLLGPERTTIEAQDPRHAARLSSAREFGQVQGREQARAMPYEDLVGGGVPQNLTDFAGAGPVPAGSPGGPMELRWGPEDFSLRSGPAMALLGGQMDPMPAARRPMPVSEVGPREPLRGAPARRTLGDVEQQRAIELARTKAENASDIRREAKAEEPDKGVTWQPYYDTEGRMVGFYNPKDPSQTRSGPPGMAGRTPSTANPPERGAVTWQPYYGNDGKLAGFYNPKDPAQRRDAPPDMAKPGSPPAQAKPKKFADFQSVFNSVGEMPPPPKPASKDDGKDAEKIAEIRAGLIQTYQDKLNASVGDAGMAANLQLRKAGWDEKAIRAAQGKTGKYLPQQAPTGTAAAPAAAPTPGPGPAAPQGQARATAPPPQQTRDAVKAELRRLLSSGMSAPAAAQAMRSAGWQIQ